MYLEVLIKFSLRYSLKRYLILFCRVRKFLRLNSNRLDLVDFHFALNIEMNNCLFIRTLSLYSFLNWFDWGRVFNFWLSFLLRSELLGFGLRFRNNLLRAFLCLLLARILLLRLLSPLLLFPFISFFYFLWIFWFFIIVMSFLLLTMFFFLGFIFRIDFRTTLFLFLFLTAAMLCLLFDFFFWRLFKFYYFYLITFIFFVSSINI